MNTSPGDVAITFDNTQVIGKTYNVKPQNKISTSVVTNSIVLQLDRTGTLQSDPSIMPREWFVTDNMQENVEKIRNIEASNEYIADLDKAHYWQLY